MRAKMLTAIVLTTVAAGACLQKDTTSTIYLDPSGRAEWIVLDQQVRSDAQDDDVRTQEEAAYITAMHDGTHPVARAFEAMGATDVETRPLRTTRPFSARVSGTFADLAGVVTPWLSACRIPHTVDVQRDRDEVTWTLTVDLGPDGTPPTPEGCEVPFDGLIDASGVSVVLTSGHFVEATGFTLATGDRATLDDRSASDDTIAATGGRLVYRLRWRLR